jgi:hypothetical protein
LFLDDKGIFPVGEWLMLDFRAKAIEPSLSALLCSSRWNQFYHIDRFLWAKVRNRISQQFIFRFIPGPSNGTFCRRTEINTAGTLHLEDKMRKVR